jgi:hypothetical protein
MVKWIAREAREAAGLLTTVNRFVLVTALLLIDFIGYGSAHHTA